MELNILYSMWFISCVPITLEKIPSTSSLSSVKIEIKIILFYTIDKKIRTYSNRAQYLVHSLLLLVKEDRAPEADDQVRILLEKRHLVRTGQVGEARKTVGDPEEGEYQREYKLCRDLLPRNSLNLKFVSLKRRACADLENTGMIKSFC